jgi:hypothetical protein
MRSPCCLCASVCVSVYSTSQLLNAWTGSYGTCTHLNFINLLHQ